MIDSALTLVLQSGIDVSVPRQTTEQYYFAVAAVAMAVVASIVAYWRINYSGLPDSQQENKSKLKEELYEQSPYSLRIPRGADPFEYVDDIVERLEAAETAQNGGEPDLDAGTSVIEAGWLILQDVIRAVDERLAGIPRLAQSLGLVAILTVVLGALAVSIDWIVGGLTSEPGTIAVGEVLGELVDITVSVLDAGHSVLTAFPYGGLVFDLTYAHLILFFQILYYRWYAVAVLLVALAIVITLLDLKVPEDVDKRLFTHQADTTLHAIGYAALIWLAGVVPATLGALVGLVGPGAALGFICAFVVFAWSCWRASKRFRVRIHYASRIHWPEGSDRLLATYLLARYLAGALLAFAGPLVAIYAVVVIAEGRVGQLLGAIGDASLPIQLTILVAVLGALAWTAYQARAQWPALRSAFANGFAEKRVRLAIFRRGSVALGVVFGAALGWALFGPLAALPFGVLVGAAVWTVHWITIRARHRSDLIPNPLEPHEPFDALVQCYALPDTDGDIHYVADVGGRHRFARDDPRACAVDVATATEDFLAAEPLTPTVGEWHARDCFDYGIVDEEETIDKLEQRVQKAALGILRKYGRVPEEMFDQLVEKYPEDIRRRRLELLYNHEIVSRHNGIVQLERDIFSESERERRETELSIQ